MFSMTLSIWIGFLLLVGLVVALDLGVFHRKAHVVSLPEAIGWTTVWVSLALAFTPFVALWIIDDGDLPIAVHYD